MPSSWATWRWWECQGMLACRRGKVQPEGLVRPPAWIILRVARVIPWAGPMVARFLVRRDRIGLGIGGAKC